MARRGISARSECFQLTGRQRRRSNSLPGIIQPKLAIGRVDDPLELEADRIADQVTRMVEPSGPLASGVPQVSRKCAACEDEEGKMLQPEPVGPERAATGETARSLRMCSGRLASRSIRIRLQFMEGRFERDFRNVRIHTDGVAAELGSGNRCARLHNWRSDRVRPRPLRPAHCGRAQADRA